MTPPQSSSVALDCVVLILPRTRLCSLGIFVASQDPADAQHTAQHQAVLPDQQQVCLRLAVSQLVVLDSASIDGMSTNESHRISGLPTLKLARKSGRGVKTACVHCRDVGKRCDSGRPCSRCKRIGLSGCRDAPSKAKKTTSKRAAAGPTPDHHPQPTASTPTPAYDLPQLVPHLAPQDITPPASQIGSESTHAIPLLWNAPARYFASDAQMSDTYTSASTDGDNISPMTYYAYDHPAPGQGPLNQFVPSTSFPPMTVYTSADRHTVDIQGPWDYFNPYNLVSGSSPEGLPKFETYSISQSYESVTDIQAPWDQGW